jgi:photosystem II stability/assembly factor-like uncharacterized protein
MKNNKAILISIVVIAAVLGAVFLNQSKKTDTLPIPQSNQSDALYPENQITHGHGLAVDVFDSNKVYIATHHGLLVLINDKDLYRVGKSKDDYMGFSPHPADSNIFFSSGHPEKGGNIGFQQSSDGAVTWKKVADGVGGPVDFHAMAVSPANPNIVYGWYGGNLQKSTNQGKTWQIVGATDFVVVRLAADPKDDQKLYASSPQGLFVSINQGKTWQPISEFAGSFVATIAIDPANNQTLLSFSEKRKLAKSSDGGNRWESIAENFAGGTVLYIAFNPQNPAIVYALTEKNLLFKSLDRGNKWNKIR